MGTVQVWGCGGQELIRAANWWGEASLCLGVKGLPMHLICDRKLSWLACISGRGKPLGEKQKSSRPKIWDVEHGNTDLTVICQQLNDPFQILMQPFLQRGSAEHHDPVQTAGAEPCGFLHSCVKTAIYLIWLFSFYSHRTVLLLSRVQHSEEPLLSFAAFLSACSRWRSRNVRNDGSSGLDRAGGGGEGLVELWVLADCPFQNQLRGPVPPCAFGQTESQVEQPLLNSSGPNPCSCILHWGVCSGLCRSSLRWSGVRFIKVQGGSLQRSCARQWEMLCTV